MHEIITFGYQGMRMEKIVEAMIRRNAVVLDCRFSPYSPFPGWRKPAFQAALGDRYVWVKGFGNVNYKGGPVRLYDEAAGFKIIAMLGKANIFSSLAVMCACADVEHCHRKHVAYKIEGVLQWPVQHLKSEDIMGLAEKKPPSDAVLRRQQRAAAKLAQETLFSPDQLKKKFEHRDDS